MKKTVFAAIYLLLYFAAASQTKGLTILDSLRMKAGSATINKISPDTALSDNSDKILATQRAVKQYVLNNSTGTIGSLTLAQVMGNSSTLTALKYIVSINPQNGQLQFFRNSNSLLSSGSITPFLFYTTIAGLNNSTNANNNIPGTLSSVMDVRAQKSGDSLLPNIGFGSVRMILKVNPSVLGDTVNSYSGYSNNTLYTPATANFSFYNYTLDSLAGKYPSDTTYSNWPGVALSKGVIGFANRGHLGLGAWQIIGAKDVQNSYHLSTQWNDSLIGTYILPIRDSTNTGFARSIYAPGKADTAQINGYLNMNGQGVLHVPDTTLFNGTMIFGNGGGNLSHTTGTTGQQDLLIGYNAGQSLTTATQVTAAGDYAAQNLTTGGFNTMYGWYAGNQATTGSANTYLGARAGQGDSGSNNVAIGLAALSGNYGAYHQTGNYNTVTGYEAGRWASNITQCAFYGRASGIFMLNGAMNTGLGYGTLEGLHTYTVNENTAVGFRNQHWITNGGDSSTSVGSQALFNDSTGGWNVALGQRAGFSINQGGKNIIIGTGNIANAFGSSNTIIATAPNSMPSATMSNTVMIGAGKEIRLFSDSLGHTQIINNATWPASIPSAELAVSSTTAGLLPPRMTTTQKNAISSPAEGLCVYDLTLHKLYVWDGSIWQAAW